MPRVLGVDDFALRCGHRYGTILIDMETRRPIDVVTDRDADTLKAWRRERRRQSRSLIRWHIWKKLGDAVEWTLARHRHCLSTAVNALGDTPQRTDTAECAAELHRGPVEPRLHQDRVAVRTQQRYAETHALLAQGKSIRGIGTQLGLARGTARRFARAESPEEPHRLPGQHPRRVQALPASTVERGCINAAQLFEEITARGYRGQQNFVRTYLRAFRATAHIPVPPPKPPAVRRVTAWFMTDPAHIDPDDQRRLDSILAASPELDSLAGHVRAFAAIMEELRGRDLERWMTTVDAGDQPRSACLCPRLSPRPGRSHPPDSPCPWSSGHCGGRPPIGRGCG
ncbi:transposase [Nocardia brasiliensis]|uniref:transposase n=1 Tax=Nocardia brasiliensis TaxID=37326 RepID=UPI002453F80F|nr:transposase [Nocardia brasiliensis]